MELYAAQGLLITECRVLIGTLLKTFLHGKNIFITSKTWLMKLKSVFWSQNVA